MAKRIIPVYTTGVYRIDATIKGVNKHALPSELVDGYAWEAISNDGELYSRLHWELAPPPVSVAYGDGFRAAHKGGSEDDNSWLPGDHSDAWDKGFADAKAGIDKEQRFAICDNLSGRQYYVFDGNRAGMLKWLDANGYIHRSDVYLCESQSFRVYVSKK